MSSPTINQVAEHDPVMVDEVVEGLAIDPAGVYVDATFGKGGHAKAILAKLGPKGQLRAADADIANEKVAEAIDDPRLSFRNANFRDLASFAEPGEVAGVVMDLGLSLDQLRDSERGFSFRDSGPLDMRIDQDSGKPLAQMIAKVPERTLGKILREYGEERHWKRIAAKIVQRRRDRQLNSTADLAAACLQGSSHKWQRIHPATRVFQALRIWVNDELSNLVAGLEAANYILRPGGRLAVISFHSLEDRIVKRFLKRDPESDHDRLEQVAKLVRPSAEEVERNRLARSAKLRIGVKITQPQPKAAT